MALGLAMTVELLMALERVMTVEPLWLSNP